MDLGLATERLGRLCWDLVRAARFVAPRFYSTEITLTGTPNLIGTFPDMMTLGFQNTFIGVEYLPETGHSALINSLPAGQNAVAITMVPWADRNRPFGQFPMTFMDTVLYPLGSVETWEDVGALYLNYPTVPTTPLIIAVGNNFPYGMMMEEPAIAALAEAMAVRAVSMKLDVPLDHFVQRAAEARATFIQTLLPTGRPRVKRVRDIGP
jgi:hypothetical protein